MNREQRSFPIQGNGADQLLDIVAAYLDPTVGEEELEAILETGDVAELLVGPGLGPDASALLLQPVDVCEVFDRGPRVFSSTEAGMLINHPELSDNLESYGISIAVWQSHRVWLDLPRFGGHVRAFAGG